MSRHESKFIVTQQNVAMNKDGKKEKKKGRVI